MRYIVNTSKFKPLTFEEILRPLAPSITQLATAKAALQKDLEDAMTIERIVNSLDLNEEGNLQIVDDYNAYLLGIRTMADDLSTMGKYDSKGMLDLRNKYIQDILNIKTTDALIRKMQETLSADQKADSSLIWSTMGQEPTFSQMYKNPYVDLYKKISGDLLAKEAQNTAAGLAELLDSPDITSDGFIHYNSDITLEEMNRLITLIDGIMKGNINIDDAIKYGMDIQMFDTVLRIYDTSGVASWDNEFAKNKALNRIYEGMYNAVGKSYFLPDSRKTGDSDSSGGGGLVLYDTNSLSVLYIGTNLSEEDNEHLFEGSTSKSQNLRMLYDMVDEDNNIHLNDGSKVNILEAILDFNVLNDVYDFLKTDFKEKREKEQEAIIKANQHLKKKYNRSILKTLDKLNRDYNKEDFFDYRILKKDIAEYQNSLNLGYKYADEKGKKQIEESLKNGINYVKDYLKNKYKNTNIDNIPEELIKSLYDGNNFDHNYSQLLMYIDKKDLKEGDLALQEQTEKSNKILASAMIDFYNLDKYLPEKALENISKYGVHTTYAMDPQNHAIETNWLLVTDPKGDNKAIAGNLRTAIGNGKGIIYSTDDGLNIKGKDNEGMQISELKDMMLFDDEGNPKAFRIYLNPAILHYDDYNYNELIKDKYILEFKTKDGTKKVLIEGKYLGSDYENLMKQSLFDYSQNDPSTLKTDYRGYDPNRLYTNSDIVYVRSSNKS